MTLAPLSLKIAGKSKLNGKNDTKCLKNAVKTAKKPILREKCAVAATSPKTSRIANLGDKVHRWTAEEALAAGKKGGQTFAIRNALRKDFERSAAEGGKLSAIFDKAIKTLDIDLLTFVEKAAKLVGATFDQSEEAKQKIELAGKLDNNLNVHIEKV
jgi:hypothetical protein